MSIFKRTQRKYVKKAYRVRNWREYEAGLRNRGSLTVWSSLTAGKLVNWDAPRPRRRKPGRQRKYSNHAIETAVTLGMVFHLSSRQSEGLLRSLFALMKLDNDVPDHTTLSRCKPKLGKVLCLLFIHPPAHGSEVSPAARNTLDSARIPRASKLLICGLFLKGRVLAQDDVSTRPAESRETKRSTYVLYRR